MGLKSPIPSIFHSPQVSWFHTVEQYWYSAADINRCAFGRDPGSLCWREMCAVVCSDLVMRVATNLKKFCNIGVVHYFFFPSYPFIMHEPPYTRKLFPAKPTFPF
jgi:hypothetical protein